ncbi:MAG: hypothetical protein IJY80_00660, partial [Opitutales bacterium]|nr:hypothetical protein [Opitutales bacterium]
KKTIIIATFLFCILSGILILNNLGSKDGELAFCVNGQTIYSCGIPREGKVLRLSATQFRVALPVDSAEALCAKTLKCNLKAGDIQQIFWEGREIATVRRRESPSKDSYTIAQYFPPEYVSVFFENETQANNAIKNFHWEIVVDFSTHPCRETPSSLDTLFASVLSTEKANDFILEERRSRVFDDPTGQFYIERRGEKVRLPENVIQAIFHQADSIDSNGCGKIPRLGTWFEL